MKRLNLITITFCLFFTFACEKTIINPFPEVTVVSPNVGPPGSAVTITGSGFSTLTGETGIAFNGRRAAIISVTSTRLETTVPDSATTGMLSVTVNFKSVNGPIFIVEELMPTTSKLNTRKNIRE